MKADNRYVSYIDGFRGYAILLVLLSHFELAQMDVAFMGVTLFFFVSGFLITKLLIFEYNKHGEIKLKEFYLRRIFRLYPALMFMLVVSIITLLLHNYKIIWADILAGLFYFTNYYLVYFHPALPDTNYLLVSKILWSLSVEEHFYLIFPVLFISFYSDNNRRLSYLLGGLLILFLFIRFGAFYRAPDSTTAFQITYYTTHCRADSILFGCFSALLIYKYQAKWYLKMLHSHILFWTALAILAFTLIYNAAVFQTTIKYNLQGIAFGMLVPSFSLLFTRGFIYSLVDNKVMVFIGKLSYSLYLFHWVALKVGNLYFDHKGPGWYLLVVPLTAVLSLISYFFVERPFVALRRKFGSNARVAVS